MLSWCEFSGNAARHGPATRDTETYILGQAGSQLRYVTHGARCEYEDSERIYMSSGGASCFVQFSVR